MEASCIVRVIQIPVDLAGSTWASSRRACPLQLLHDANADGVCSVWRTLTNLVVLAGGHCPGCAGTGGGGRARPGVPGGGPRGGGASLDMLMPLVPARLHNDPMLATPHKHGSAAIAHSTRCNVASPFLLLRLARSTDQSHMPRIALKQALWGGTGAKRTLQPGRPSKRVGSHVAEDASHAAAAGYATTAAVCGHFACKRKQHPQVGRMQGRRVVVRCCRRNSVMLLLIWDDMRRLGRRA
jgi:hypothetical protein